MVMRRAGVAAFMALAGTAGAQMGVPYRVADLPRGSTWTPSNRWTDLGLFARLGERAVFIANDGWLSGREPWITDGTPEGTHPITELDPRPGMDLDPVAVMSLDDHGVAKVVYAGRSEGGLVLAFTDGTAGGTAVSDPIHGYVTGLNAGLLGSLDGRVLLAVSPTGSAQQELWIAGPGAGQTRRLAQVGSGYSASPIFVGAANGRAYCWLNAPSGRRLWVTDGTPEGTAPVAGVPDSSFSQYPGSALIGQTLIASVPEVGNAGRCWAVDLETGIAAALTLPQGVSPQGGPVIGRPEEGFALFSATGGLWRTDGTPEGTALFKADVRSSLLLSGSSPINVTIGPPGARRTFFYGTTADEGEELWVTDGTPDGTEMLASLAAGNQSAEPVAFGVDGTSAWFGRPGGTTWWTQGTAETTREVPTAPPDRTTSSPGTLAMPYTAAVGGRLLRSPRFGLPWSISTMTVTDRQGVVTSFDAGPGDPQPGSTSARSAVGFGGGAAFLARGATTSVGLYATDATSAGTRLVMDLPSPAPLNEWSSLTPVGPLLWLYARGYGHGTTYLWRSDGTGAGTFQAGTTSWGLDAFHPSSGPFAAGGDGVVFFSRAVQTSTGAAGSIRRLSPQTATSANDLAVDHLGRVYYGVWSGSNLVVHCLTPQTGVDATVYTFAGAFEGISFAEAGGAMFFCGFGTGGPDVIRSDGTTAGTARVLNLRSNNGGTGPVSVTTCGGGVVCFQFDRVVNDRALWWIDGATGTPTLVRHFASVGSVAAMGDRAVFLADDGEHGTEPWITDGTLAGTRMIAETVPGVYGVYGAAPALMGVRTLGLEVVGDLAFFNVATPDLAPHPWVTDGTAAGTRPLGATPEGSRLYAGRGFARTPGAVVFSAWTDATSTDLFAVRLCAPDFNADAFLDFFDYLGYIDAFEAGTPDADFNGDGFLDFFDYDAFVGAFERGC